jgi:hypothetical protein
MIAMRHVRLLCLLLIAKLMAATRCCQHQRSALGLQCICVHHTAVVLYHPLLYVLGTANQFLVLFVPVRGLYTRASRVLAHFTFSYSPLALAHWLVWSDTHLREHAP